MLFLVLEVLNVADAVFLNFDNAFKHAFLFNELHQKKRGK